MEKSYNPVDFESQVYAEWEKLGAFTAESSSTRPPFVIPLPPPNVTGALHIGHALVTTLQDTLIRWKRMSGYNALWMPGTDHAGIATQMVVERFLAKNKILRSQLGREEFVKKIWEWKEKHGEIITEQMRKLGASCDWSRSRFTMDPGFCDAVTEVFVTLYKEGLIYRGTRITSRCTRCETVLSDLEVIPKERKSKLWHIRYFTKDQKLSVVIATTRPETLLGDTAVAIHPNDDRFLNLHSKQIVIPLVNRIVPIILDEYVDPAFGTGALKVTPAHDVNDFELGKKHRLESIGVIDLKGKLNSLAGPYQGLSVMEARDKIVLDLDKSGLIVKTEEITNQVGVCQRCETVVEPLISMQWFLKMEPLAKPVLNAAQKGELLTLAQADAATDVFKIVPDVWNSTFYHWMNNIRDWCVSRQLWWGHRIPAYYCKKCQHVMVEKTHPTKCIKCNDTELVQDEDVLDTWFSSALWPFAGVGWPINTKDYNTFYPASILETGFDILFFWVARMLMLGMHFNDGKVPFKRVYLHGMVRDEKGQKMSKTKGNVVDPLDLVKDYGADAFRFSLMAMSGQGRDLKLSLDRIEGYRAFCNKLWNASRYVILNLSSAKDGIEHKTKVNSLLDKNSLLSNRPNLHVVNRWILSRLEESAIKINLALDNFRMAEASQELYVLLWNDYCDWYIEFSKELLKNTLTENETKTVMLYVLEEILHLAHPFIPFITEEIYKTVSELNEKKDSSKKLIQSDYPWANSYRDKESTKFTDQEATEIFTIWKDAVNQLRNFRGENQILPQTSPKVTYDAEATVVDQLTFGLPLIRSLAHLESLEPEEGKFRGKPDTGEVLSKGLKFYIPLKGLVDFEEEKKRLEKQKESIQSSITHIEKLLCRPGFVEKAPASVVAQEKKRLNDLVSDLASVEASLKRISSTQ